ncbi:hypothetical protein VIAE108258_01850 [Vibrio aerogenes]
MKSEEKLTTIVAFWTNAGAWSFTVLALVNFRSHAPENEENKGYASTPNPLSATRFNNFNDGPFGFF